MTFFSLLTGAIGLAVGLAVGFVVGVQAAEIHLAKACNQEVGRDGPNEWEWANGVRQGTAWEHIRSRISDFLFASSRIKPPTTARSDVVLRFGPTYGVDVVNAALDSLVADGVIERGGDRFKAKNS